MHKLHCHDMILLAPTRHDSFLKRLHNQAFFPSLAEVVRYPVTTLAVVPGVEIALMMASIKLPSRLNLFLGPME
jgi:hypothetical protein